MNKIYVAGHRGMVGSAIVRRLQSAGGVEIVTATHAELDLTNQAAVQAFFAAQRIDAVYLAAAKVGGIHANNTYPAEFIQQNLAEAGIKIDFEVVEWNTLINIWRAGAKHESSRGATGMNYSYFIQDPFTAFIRHLDSKLVAPNGTNTWRNKRLRKDGRAGVMLGLPTNNQSHARCEWWRHCPPTFCVSAR